MHPIDIVVAVYRNLAESLAGDSQLTPSLLQGLDLYQRICRLYAEY